MWIGLILKKYNVGVFKEIEFGDVDWTYFKEI
jgi:hypothetical protein